MKTQNPLELSDSKFMFDTSFDTGKAPKKSKTYLLKEEELAAHKEVSFIDGIAEGQRKSIESLEAQTLTLVNTLQVKLEELLDIESQKRNLVISDALELARVVAQSIVIGKAQEAALDQVEEVLSNHLKTLKDHPNLKVKVHSSLIAPLEAKWKSPHLTLEGDDSIAPTDCQICWVDGGIERHLQTILSQINNTIQNYVPILDTTNQTKENSNDE